MSIESAESNFWSVNLHASIQTASEQDKPLLCFVTDQSPVSLQWLETIANGRSSEATANATVRLRIQKDSQEFTFLNGVCPLSNLPALVLIRAGQIEEKLEHPETSVQQLNEKLSALYPPTNPVADTVAAPETNRSEQCLQLGSSAGRMRLPNNAYDALRKQTEKWKAQSISPKNILLLQLRLLEKVAALKETVLTIKSRGPESEPTLPEDAIDRLLNTPASALQPRQTSPPPNVSTSSSPRVTPTPTQAIPSTTNTTPSTSLESTPNAVRSSEAVTTNQSQRNEYVKQQREREAAQRLERERIKAQIKSDREERRRIDSLRKQSELASLREQNSTTSSPSSTDIRIQVRTFDGSTLRTTFPNSAKIASDVRTWIDQSKTDNNANNAPYNLKLILTPLPNRNIEAGEEEKPLPELGIVGSATMVMVPVKGYVDSYASSGPGMGVFGGLLGTTGRLVDWLLGMVGYGNNSAGSQMQSQSLSQPRSEQRSDIPSTSEAGVSTSGSNVKVRTLADQRAEEQRKRGNQLYNGNSLDFQGRADDDQHED